MTVDFENLAAIFEVDREEQEEDLQEFFRCVSPELYHQLKGFVQFFLSIYFNYEYSFENYHPRFFTFLYYL